MTPKPCVHCGLRPGTRARGMCWSCYETPGLRDHYESGLSCTRRGLMNGNRTPPVPPAPTDLRPGSPEKVALLAARNEAGFALWHPADQFDQAG